MSRRIAFILSATAGGRSDGEAFLPFRERIDQIANGGPVTVVRTGGDIREAVRGALAQACDAVVAAGGDGTLNAVASCLVGTPVVFGVMPFGTLNHFARDAGIPLDANEALDVIERGRVDTVDVGQIAGRHFLNNASLGLYVQVVRHRELQQSRLGRGKWPAFAWALWSALRRFPFMTFRIDVDGVESEIRTPFLFLGNNRYEINGLKIGRRQSLQGGTLSIYHAERAGRRRLFVFALHALLGRLGSRHDFHETTAKRLHISSRHRSLRLATDGEVVQVETPLDCRILARALKVYVPGNRS
ncbi:MAG: diacylglycerol/lipid kinase family protein [Vitreoscilla sp.]